jgi:hypothetical protein
MNGAPRVFSAGQFFHLFLEINIKWRVFPMACLTEFHHVNS